MGYAAKLQKLCSLRNVDQASLAVALGISKSTISRIISGVQEPKLTMAVELARTLGVTLDYLVDDTLDLDATHQMVVVSEEEVMILKLVRRLGPSVAIDRLLDIHRASSGQADAPLKTREEPAATRLQEAHGSRVAT